jgi:hypothetical protein
MSFLPQLSLRTEIVNSKVRAALEELQENIVRLTKGQAPIVSDAGGAGAGEGQPPSPPAPKPEPTPAPAPARKSGSMFAYEVSTATIGKESNGYLPYAAVELSIHNRSDEPVRVLAARNSFTIRTDGGPNFVPMQRDWMPGLPQCPSAFVPYCKNDDRADPLYVDIGPNATERFSVTLHTATRPTSTDMKVLVQLISGSLSGSLYAKYPNRRGGAVETVPVSVPAIAFRNSLGL